ncbi:MAG: homoserine O-succinyltransferase [Eubacterium sp.]|nr:homoserine O-succinyltransferase [Eubacterium sp.]
MPIKIQSDLPAREILEKENIFVMDENRALHQDVRPIQIGILNLMPVKEDTELQLLRALSNTPLQIDVSFLTLTTHESKNTPLAHLNKFYTTVPEIIASGVKLDGLIVTGAPLEKMDYDKVDFWDELVRIFDWADHNVTSVLCVCWGALAGLYHYYGVPKYPLEKKLSGIYSHRVLERKKELVRGFDDVFYAPHSRFSEVRREDIEKVPSLCIVAESKEAGVYLVIDEERSNIFIMGHPEYDRMTLDGEYKRDAGKGLDPDVPSNYYEDDNPEIRPDLTWRANGTLLYTNWLNYYVYQTTPYDINDVD